jgi:crossover junction endodeoxyribonuclease RusA
MQHKFTVKGRPLVKGRPRFARGRAYTPKNTLDGEKRIAEAYNGPFFEGPISISCVFSWKRTTITIRSLDEEKSRLRGDTTNYLKLVEDGLNGVAYEDDRQVQRIVGRKK